MLTQEDKKEIRKIVRDENTSIIKASLVELKSDRKILKDIWEFVKDHTRQLTDHEERLSQVESGSKL